MLSCSKAKQVDIRETGITIFISANAGKDARYQPPDIQTVWNSNSAILALVAYNKKTVGGMLYDTRVRDIDT
jgi:hypothetical protein